MKRTHIGYAKYRIEKYIKFDFDGGYFCPVNLEAFILVKGG